MVQGKFLHSRAHPLNSLPGFIKREDELSFGVSGNKLRKINALIPYFLKNKISPITACGSAHSNFLLGLAQHLNEHQIAYTFQIKRPHILKRVGNFAFLERLVPPEAIQWVDQFIPPKEGFFLPEGGFHPIACEGAATLADSIRQNEQELGITFDRIFIDSGTGLSAIGLLHGTQNEWDIHIFSMKDDEVTFAKKLNQDLPYTYHTLTNAKAFGSTNATSLNQIDIFAKNEGILLDPIYSSKMIYELSGPKRHLLTTRSLIIHSGGALSLTGFTRSEELPAASNMTVHNRK